MFQLKKMFLVGAMGVCLTRCTTASTYSPKSFLLDNKGFSQQSKEYSKERANEDISVLLQFFKNGYSGYEFVDKSLIKSAESSLNKLRGYDALNWTGLCEKIARIFNNLPDSHLDSTIGNSCLPAGLSSDRFSDIGRNISTDHPEKAYSFLIEKRGQQSYGVIGIKKFLAFDDRKWEGFESAISELKNTAKIVIDLRGNGGGDSSRGMQLAGLLKGVEIVKSEYAMDFERTSAEASILMINKMTLKSLQSSDGAWDRPKRNYEEKLNHTPSEKYISSFGIGSLKKSIASSKAFVGPIFVLVDSQTGSSAESTIQALRTLANVKIVGQYTAGAIHFGNQGLLILPNSRIRISMSTKFVKFKDGSNIEKVGFKPDLAIADGINALDYVLNNF